MVRDYISLHVLLCFSLSLLHDELGPQFALLLPFELLEHHLLSQLWLLGAVGRGLLDEEVRLRLGRNLNLVTLTAEHERIAK